MYIASYTRVFLIFIFTTVLCVLSYHLLELFSYLPTLSIICAGLILFNIFDVFRNFMLIVKFRVFLERGCLINFYQLLINVISNIKNGLRYLLYLRFKSKSVAKHITFYIVSLKISGLFIAMSIYFHLLTVFKIITCIIIILQTLSDLQLLDDLKCKLEQFYSYLDNVFTKSLENPDRVLSEENLVLQVQYHEQNFDTLDTDHVFKENDESELNYLEKFYPNSPETFSQLEDTDSEGNSIFDMDDEPKEETDLISEPEPQKQSQQSKSTAVLRREFFSLLQQNQVMNTTVTASTKSKLEKSTKIQEPMFLSSSEDEDDNYDVDTDFVVVGR